MQQETVVRSTQHLVRPWIPAVLAWPFLIGAADEIAVVVSGSPLAGVSSWLTIGIIIAVGWRVGERHTTRSAFVFLALSVVLAIGAAWWSSVAERVL